MNLELEQNLKLKIRQIGKKYPSQHTLNIEKHLGMAIRYKEAGKSDNEAKDKPQHPGYKYVSRRGHSSHYGYWRGSYWHWYPHYSQGRRYWGRDYRISHNDYDNYRRHSERGKLVWQYQ